MGTQFSNQVTIISDELTPTVATIDTKICEKVVEVAETDVVYNPAYTTNPIIVTMVLPPHIRIADVDAASGLILNPGMVLDPNPIVGGIEGRVKVRGFFDPGLVRAVTGEASSVEVTIQGTLVNGRHFQGKGKVVFPK